MTPGVRMRGTPNIFFRSHPAFTARYVLGNILPNLRKVGTRGGIYLYGPEPPAIGCGAPTA